ncbi:MAG: hypothetical protein WA003_08215 [Desulfuromonadaceae bacterium]
MSDLIDQAGVDEFRQAMRDLTDTFHKTPVTLKRKTGEEIPLLAGWKPDDVGSYGNVNGEAYVQEAQRETVERFVVSFNRDYLSEQGLTDPDTDLLLISEDDKLIFQGKRFVLVKITDKGVFRGVPILVRLTVQR